VTSATKPIKGTIRTLRVLLELLGAGQQKRFLEVQALADEYQISDQAIYNDMKAISNAGFVLVKYGSRYAAQLPENHE
jgi:DeoR/GlpR family transcriptional regulator of sugar metabolism